MTSCASLQRTSTSLYQNVYERSEEFDHETFVRQHGVDSARVYFSLRTDKLLHKRPDRDSDYQVIVDFAVLIKHDGVQVGDTLRHRFQRSYSKNSSELVSGYMTIPLKDSLRYQVELTLTDVLSRKSELRYFFLERESDDPRFTQIWVNGMPRRFCACDPGDEVLIQVHGWEANRSQLSSYSMESGIAPPPFSISPWRRPELTLLSSEEISHSGGISITCPDADEIHLQNMLTEEEREILRLPSSYPRLESHADMTQMLEYVTSSNEFKEMQQMNDSRAALEHFWTECGGSKERAKTLIDHFYARVEEANRFFTEEVAGWKSDRGIMHIIYGPPGAIMRLEDREIWFYGTENSGNDWNVVFFKREVFEMDRSLDYRPSWFLTVESWRNGRLLSQ